jgi:hypothetical protein
VGIGATLSDAEPITLAVIRTAQLHIGRLRL